MRHAEVDALRSDKVAAYTVAIERAFIKFIRGRRAATRFLTIFGLHLGHCLAVWLSGWLAGWLAGSSFSIVYGILLA